MPKKAILSALLLTYTLALGKVFAADTTPPITTYIQTPASPDGKAGWYVSSVLIDLTASDLESGVSEINYRVDGGVWQKADFSDTLNLVQNPSFEFTAATSSGIDKWDSTLNDASGSASYDNIEFAPGYDIASAKITATEGLWHGINNKQYFAAATPFDNMNSSAWLKTSGVADSAYYTVYAVNSVLGVISYQQIASSQTLIGTNNWTLLSLNFTVNSADAVGVYIDIGVSGAGTVWADAVNINSAVTAASTSVNVSTDNADHTVEFYSADGSGNTETYSCSNPIKNCLKFKIDQTPPENWQNAKADTSSGNKYNVWARIEVEDFTSKFDIGVQDYTYMYHTELQSGFGRFSDLSSCSSTWQPDVWTQVDKYKIRDDLIRVRTPRTSFCNTNWNQCKIVRYRVEDMAGNVATKDVCINGPWIKARWEGSVRSDNNITMSSEGQGDNTNGLIETAGTTIDLFTSNTDWRVKNSPIPSKFNYDDFWKATKDKTTITSLNTTSGVYLIDDNFTINNSTLPSNYDTATFDHLIFVNGNLTIDAEVDLKRDSAALFIVKGDVKVSKNVNLVKLGIFADGDFYSAYDLLEGDTNETLLLYGAFAADTFEFQRTLQGADNSDDPAESFFFEAKYLIQLKKYFANYSVKYLSVE